MKQTTRSGRTTTASAAALPAQISTVDEMRASLEKQIRYYREFPKVLVREFHPKADALQAILDGGPAAILREAKLEKRRRAQRKRRAAEWLRIQDAKERADRAALAASPDIDTEVSLLSREVLVKAIALTAARRAWRENRAEIEAPELPEPYVCALQEAHQAGLIPDFLT